jgi:hypothetical protein
MTKTKKSLLLALIILISNGIFFTGFSSCAKRKNREKNTVKPMRPSEKMYSAYDPQYNWALEMEIDGNFSFIDYTNNLDVHCKTSSFEAIQIGNKMGLKWVMQTADSLKVQIQIFEENCYNFGFQNNPFVFELSNEMGVLYRVGGCGSYHQAFGFNDKFELSTINGIDFRKSTTLTDAPIIKFSKIKTSNLIDGKIGCRTFRSQFNILSRSFGISFDLYPNMSCEETTGLSNLMERIGEQEFHFLFSENNNKLTLSNKNDTFVFIKTN